MVAQYLDWVARALQVRPPFLERPDDCKEFLIVDFIIAFCRAVFFRVKGHHVQDTFVVIPYYLTYKVPPINDTVIGTSATSAQ